MVIRTATFAGSFNQIVCDGCGSRFDQYDEWSAFGCSAHTEMTLRGGRMVSAGYGSVFDTDDFTIVTARVPSCSVVCDACVLEWLRNGDIVYWKSVKDFEASQEDDLYFAIGVAIGQWRW